ncbi:MAG: hypothetical protein H6581_14050 [Bacteroidia bacterium]|nr:hypothetical protein [Bacteroidia bacterium]
MGLLTDLNGITGGQSACSLLEVPVNALKSAADSLENMRDNPPAGIRQLSDKLKQLQVPRIEGVDVLSDGIRALKSEIPEDLGELTQPIADAMGDFFAGLEDSFAGQLDNMLMSFTGLDKLGQVGISNPIEESLTDTLQEMQEVLNIIPNPLNVETLLEFLNSGLSKFNRAKWGYRYMPLVDELRDKLQTTLKWKDSNGAEIAADVQNTLERLSAALRRNFIEEPLTPLADSLTDFNDSINASTLDAALTGMLTNLGTLASAVQAGDLTGKDSDIAALLQNRTDIISILGTVDEQTEDLVKVRKALADLPDEMEDRAIHFLSIIQPPHDLEALGLVLQPLNTLVADTGLNVFMDKIGEFLGSIRGVLDSLNISSFRDSFVQVISGAEAAVDGLRNILMKMTIEFSALMDRIKDAIQRLGISSLIDTMENGLLNFIDQIKSVADTIFQPVRAFLLGIFNTINGFLDQLDPSVVVNTLRDLISKFTDLLGNPQLLQAIDSVKAALDTMNAELGTFSFKPGTDLVVQGIDVVEKALQIASSLPLPDSLKKELRDALNQLPRSLDPAVDIITDGLTEIVDEGPKPVLLQIKVGPQKLVDTISKYSPEKLVNECLGTTYQDFLTQMERFKPSALLVPIQEALDVVKTEVRRIGDPVEILDPLNEPFQELMSLLDAFDPEELIGPLADQLQDGIQIIVQSLPIGSANAIFDQIANVANNIQSLSDTLTAVHDFMEGFRLRLADLSDAKTQIQTLGSDIASRINQVSDLTGINTAMAEVAVALGEIQGAALKAQLDGPINAIAAKLNPIDAKNRLAAIAAAIQVFPTDQIALLVPSLNRDNLEFFLNNFDPISAALAAPVDLMEKLPGQLNQSKAGFDDLMQNWDTRYLEPSGPIMQLYQPALTVGQLQTMLTDTITNQLTQTLEPIMQLIENLQAGLDGILQQMSGLVDDINEILTDILAITDALEDLRDALNSLIETLLNLDFGFVGEGLQDVFDALRTELEALSPAAIAKVLAKAFDELLSILDINKLLGAADLDLAYHDIVENLRRLDPAKIIVDVLQPEFEKVLEFLLRFDLSVQIDKFLELIQKLQEDLRTELLRVSDSYEDMWSSIPSSIGGVTGVSVSVTITAN